MTVLPTKKRHSRRSAGLLLACVLSLPASPPAHAMMDDMFAVMFRMMLVMMDAMSDTMLDNDNWGLGNWGNSWGGLNSFNLGMSTLPVMSGFTSPWNSFSSPWTASPWNMPTISPWATTPWNSAFPTVRPPPAVSGYGHPAAPGYWHGASGNNLLEGRWFGNSGEILEVRGNHFKLRTAGASLSGTLYTENNIVNMYSRQTNTMTRYTFLRNQSELLLSDGTAVITFRRHPASGLPRVF